MCCFVERAVPSVMALFPSAPAQTLSPRAPPKHRIQRAALTTAPMMMKKRSIAGSWPTKPAEATTIPRNTTTLNSNKHSQQNKPSLFTASVCACHYKRDYRVSSCYVVRGTVMESQRKQTRHCLPLTHMQYKHTIYKTASFYTCNVFIWNFSVYFLSACSFFFSDYLYVFSFYFSHNAMYLY